MPKSKPNLSKGYFPIALKLCKLKGTFRKTAMEMLFPSIYNSHDNGVACVDGEGDREKITTVLDSKQQRKAAVYQDLQAEIRERDFQRPWQISHSK